MKSLIRGLTILLALLMLLPSVISCKKNKGNTDVESTESDVAEDSETVIEYDDKGYQKDNLGTQDFGGKEIRILAWKDAPFKEFAGAGATVPLTGFGFTLSEGVRKEIDNIGFLGIFTGGLKASAGGISAAILSGLIVSLIFKAQDKS